MRLNYLALLTALISAMLILLPYASQSSNIQAGVNVGCPFAITENVLASYPIYGNASLNYSIKSISICSISGMFGNFSIVNSSNGNIVYQRQLVANGISNVPTTFYLSFNTLKLSNKTYYAKINFSTVSTYNSSLSQFQMLYPANVVINKVSYEQSILQNSQVPFTISLQNKGQYASGKISLNISINGPANLKSNYSISGLSPGQYDNISVNLGAATAMGTYFVNVTASYISENALNTFRFATFHYSVNAPQSSGSTPGSIPSSSSSSPPPVAPQIVPIPSLLVSSVPLYINMLSGSSTISSISLKNTASSQETISISVPNQFANVFSLSANNITLSPAQSINIEIAVNASSSLPNGQHIIPVQIKATTIGGSTTQTEYVGLSTYQNYSDNPLAINQMNMINDTSMASDVLGIRPLQGQNSSSINIQTIIPAALVDNVSQIHSYGMASSTQFIKNAYVITWYPSKLPAGAETYGYYTINNPRNQGLLNSIQNVVVATSLPSTKDILRLIGQKLPIFYTNTTGTVQIEMLYTGIVSQPIYISLFGSQSISVLNSTQYVNATPNELITTTFEILPNSAGTGILDLYAYAIGANMSASFPVLTLPKAVSYYTASQGTQTPISQLAIDYAGGFAFIILLLVIISFIAMRTLSKPRYSQDRADTLKSIKANINRKPDGE